MFKKPSFIHQLSDNLLTVLGLVLVWRGVWYALDGLDILLFGKNHVVSAAIGTVVGFALLYFPKRNFEKIERL